MKKIILSGFLILGSVKCFAKKDANFYITAQVQSFDSKFVNVKTSPKHKLILPRSSINSEFKLQANHEWQRLPVKIKSRNQIQEIEIPLLAADNNLKLNSSTQLIAIMKKELARAKSANY